MSSDPYQGLQISENPKWKKAYLTMSQKSKLHIRIFLMKLTTLPTEMPKNSLHSNSE